MPAQFRAKLEPVPGGGHFVAVPRKVAAKGGVRHGNRVRGLVDGVAYRSSLMMYSGVFHLGVHKATVAATKKNVGDVVGVTIELDTEPLPEDTLPPALRKALATDRAVKAAWERLAPSRRRVHMKHLLAAKRPETAERRLARLLETLVTWPKERRPGTGEC